MPRFKFDAEMEIGNMLKLLLTDDGIPVRTVYVTNLNASVSRTFHFNKFICI